MELQSYAPSLTTPMKSTSRQEPRRPSAVKVVLMMVGLIVSVFATIAIVLSRALEGDWSQTTLIISAYVIAALGWVVAVRSLHRNNPKHVESLLSDTHEFDPPVEDTKPRH